MFKEFKEFALRGNVVDMAVGIVIGAAFGKIVSSLVADVMMPPIGLALGNVDFSNLAFVLRGAEGATPAVTLRYGLFLNTLIDFTIVAFALFLVVKAMNAAKRRNEKPAAPAAPAEPPPEVRLLGEIRDLLKSKQ